MMYLLLVAVAPVIALIIFFYHKDRYEKEPLSLLIKAFLIGILITVPALFLEQSFAVLFMYTPVTTNIFIIFLYAFIGVGFVEEGLKFIGLFGLMYYNKEFDEPYDGIMYAVMISLGFAFIENIFYVFRGGFYVGVLRAFLSIPGHAIFGVFMGYFMGVAKFTGRRRKNLILSFVVPSVVHGLYDFLLMTKIPALAFFIIPLLYFCWKLTIRAVKIQEEKSPFKEDD